MTEEQIKIDTLLAAGASHLMDAAEATAQMRLAYMGGDTDAAQRCSMTMFEHMGAVERVFNEAGRLIQIQQAAQLALHGITLQYGKEGLVH